MGSLLYVYVVDLMVLYTMHTIYGTLYGLDNVNIYICVCVCVHIVELLL